MDKQWSKVEQVTNMENRELSSDLLIGAYCIEYSRLDLPQSRPFTDGGFKMLHLSRGIASGNGSTFGLLVIMLPAIAACVCEDNR